MTFEKTYLKDYKSVPYTIHSLHLTFDLHESETRVRAEWEYSGDGSPLVLNGEDMELISVTVNGETATYEVDKETLTLLQLPEKGTVVVENLINPKANTKLEGLYMSSGMFCTQNEAQGFRRITYFLDRPDVLTTYTTKVIAKKSEMPVLLSNGNCIESGDLENGKHFATWHDPHPKPCYLFALVAGDLEFIEDSFTTCSGKKVQLRIYSEQKYLSRLTFSMDALKRSMKWDEDRFGLEYDLDIFMIVAVDAFNAGAMENKGLNIFNTIAVLCDKDTTTDENAIYVERVVAHEYFHNWTGDRVTCRDWFQLTLKEGLTVFRDQEFTADMHSAAVKRIEDVINLRTRQFPEDAGPTSHPIKPESYIEINNFYTSTVYEKGAEIIRMIQTLIGRDGFRKGMDTYFKLYDGQAVTTEDFIHAMEEGASFDLTQFRRWYSQNHTPVLHVETSYDPVAKEATLEVSQKLLQERAQKPFFMPFVIGLVNCDGKELHAETLILKEETQRFVFKNIDETPLFSLNRGFSAPVILETNQKEEELLALFAHDPDPFSRFEAGQSIVKKRLLHAIDANVTEGEMILGAKFIQAAHEVIQDTTIDNAFKALLLTIPSETELHVHQEVIDFDRTHQVRKAAIKAIAEAHKDSIYTLYTETKAVRDYSFDDQEIARRKLQGRLLSFIAVLEDADTIAEHFEKADNMTDSLSSLMLLSSIESDHRNKALSAFYDRWHSDMNTFTKYCSAIASSSCSDTLARVKELIEDDAFDFTIPNIVRAALFVFSGNHIHFHNKDGSGYEFMADMLLKIDAINPAVAARVSSGFRKYGKLDALRKEKMRAQLERMLAHDGLSQNLYEQLSLSLGVPEKESFCAK